MGNQVVVGNNLISFNQSGTGDSAVIFLHGWRSQKEVWGSVCRRIGESENRSFKLYALDLPGFGGSPAPTKQPLDKLGTPQSTNIEEGWGVGDYAETVKGFIEKLELKNVIIVGHSFGGRVGVKLASKYPSIISKLVLVDSAGFANQTAKKSAIGIIAKIAKPFFKAKFMQGLRHKIYNTIGAEDYVATPNLQKTFVNVVSEDLSKDMEKIICPTLIITGENDKDTPVEFGKRMQTIIHNSKFVILPGSGHFSFLDKPEDFLKILYEFM